MTASGSTRKALSKDPASPSKPLKIMSQPPTAIFNSLPQIQEKNKPNVFEKLKPAKSVEEATEKKESTQAPMDYKSPSLEIFEIRPLLNDKSKGINSSFARIRFYKSKHIWKVYWIRANWKWTIYVPIPEVESILEF